jgi:hypothetical protein
MLSASEQWQNNLKILAMLDVGLQLNPTVSFIDENYGNDIFQKTMLSKASDIIEEILKIPLSYKKKHIELDKELINVYTCRDYILYTRYGDDINIKKELSNKIIFKSFVLNTENKVNKYIKHKKIIIMNKKDFNIPDDVLIKNKNSCIRLYKKIMNLD